MEAILHTIGNNFVNFFTNVGNFFGSISDVIINVASFLLSVFGFIFYAVKTLIIGLYRLIVYLSGGAVPGLVGQTLTNLSAYIGPRGVLFISALLTIIVIRVLYAFVRKMIFNPTYKPKKNWEPTDYVDDETYPRLDQR